jgi:hypothetical protein
MCAHGWHWQQSNPDGYADDAFDARGRQAPAPPLREPAEVS